MILYGLNKYRKSLAAKVWTYVAIGIFTFGYQWTHWNPMSDSGTIKDSTGPEHIMGSAMSGLLWPLYWTADVSEHVWGKAVPPITLESKDGLCTATLTDNGMGVTVGRTRKGELEDLEARAEELEAAAENRN